MPGMPVRRADVAATPAQEHAPTVALQRCPPVPAGATAPWVLRGTAREGDAIWFEAEAADGTPLGHAVLVRRPERRPAADLGYAPVGGLEGLEQVMRLLAHESFERLGLVRLDTRAGAEQPDAARALERVGFVFVGFDRRGRQVWSVVPNRVR
jgi:RimJ/RimL family protein N-acetyltransferase